MRGTRRSRRSNKGETNPVFHSVSVYLNQSPSLHLFPLIPSIFPFPFPFVLLCPPSLTFPLSSPFLPSLSPFFPLPPSPPNSLSSISVRVIDLPPPSPPPGNRLPRKDYSEGDSSPTPPKRRKLLRDATPVKKPPPPKNLLGELLMDIPEIDICPLPTQLKSDTKATRYVVCLLQCFH